MRRFNNSGSASSSSSGYGSGASSSSSLSSTSSGPTRKASHAGSWYSDSSRELSRQLDGWLNQVPLNHGPARAVIAPHAGYAYCGGTAAYAYKQIDPDTVDRVFVLGPSHHVCLSGCALTSCSRYQTPFYPLDIDQKVNSELLASGAFDVMDLKVDEAEHSIEMHLPFIAKVMERKSEGARSGGGFTLVPVLVGSLSGSRASQYGKIFARYLADPRNLFIISSDFCHWGQRFHFTPQDRFSGLEVHEQIERMDREGMDIIESLSPSAFVDYLKRTQNTICGRHPISLMLQAAEHFHQMNNHRADFRFLHYSQSNQCRQLSDSSVSYAAGSLLIKHK